MFGCQSLAWQLAEALISDATEAVCEAFWRVVCSSKFRDAMVETAPGCPEMIWQVDFVGRSNVALLGGAVRDESR